jgi:protoporphyrinogen oxidase
MFGYLPGGYSRVFETFHNRLVTLGIGIELGATVARISKAPGGGILVEKADGDTSTFDKAVVTLAPPLAARICTGLSQEETSRFCGVEYQGIVCASVLLKKPISRYYITNLTDEGLPFTAVIEMTALVDPADLGGHTLVYLPKYLASDDPAFEEPDDSWRSRFIDTLMRMYPHLEPADVECFRISRERFVYALPTLGFTSKMPPQRTSIPGLFTVNTAQIVNGTLNVNETVRLAEEALPTLMGTA